MTDVIVVQYDLRMAADTRTRMVRGAARMVGTHGAGGTSLRELAREAGVPLGSTYHHFPGGKQQLVEEAVRSTGKHIARIIESARQDGTGDALDVLTAEWRVVLEGSDFRTGCPVLAVATEDDADLRALATEIFASWQEQLASVLTDAGVPATRAPRLARMIVGALEGAIALCRAEHSIAPLEEVTAELRTLVAEASRTGAPA
jgi:TetR/AcrR family transcriptional repressor of lmrAB and yxaGH operons